MEKTAHYHNNIYCDETYNSRIHTTYANIHTRTHLSIKYLANYVLNKTKNAVDSRLFAINNRKSEVTLG